jgi:hypothetical protein
MGRWLRSCHFALGTDTGEGGGPTPADAPARVPVPGKPEFVLGATAPDKAGEPGVPKPPDTGATGTRETIFGVDWSVTDGSAFFEQPEASGNKWSKGRSRTGPAMK